MKNEKAVEVLENAIKGKREHLTFLEELLAKHKKSAEETQSTIEKEEADIASLQETIDELTRF